MRRFVLRRGLAGAKPVLPESQPAPARSGRCLQRYPIEKAQACSPVDLWKNFEFSTNFPVRVQNARVYDEFQIKPAMGEN